MGDFVICIWCHFVLSAHHLKDHCRRNHYRESQGLCYCCGVKKQSDPDYRNHVRRCRQQAYAFYMLFREAQPETAQNIINTNRTYTKVAPVENYNKYVTFWNQYDFSIPSWVSVPRSITFDPQANLDLPWAQICGQGLVHFYALKVYSCVFEQVIDRIKKFEYVKLLKYGCICDALGHEHIHLILAICNGYESQIRELKSASFYCVFDREKLELERKIQQRQCSRNFSWPKHLHVVVQPLPTPMDLFNNIAYICHRSANEESIPTYSDFYFAYTKVKVKFKSYIEEVDLIRETDAFMSKYDTNPNYIGSHYFVFRSIVDNCQIWFSLVTRCGLRDYLEYKLQRNTLRNFYDHIVNRDGKFCLPYEKILYLIPNLPLPLPGNLGYITLSDDARVLLEMPKSSLHSFVDQLKDYHYELTQWQCETYEMIVYHVRRLEMLTEGPEYLNEDDGLSMCT